MTPGRNKLLYVTHARVPGVKAHCSQIAQMCRAFMSNGVDLELIIPQRAQLPVYQGKSISEWYGFKDEIPVTHLPCIDKISAPPGWMPTRFKGYLFSLLIGTFNRSLGKHLKRINNDYAFFSRDIGIYYYLNKRFPEKKKYIELHHMVLEKGKRQDHETAVLKHCNGIVVVTSPMKEELIKRGIDSKKILVEPNGIDPIMFPGTADQAVTRKKFGLPEKDSIILFLGNFHALGVSRGLDTIVKAAKSILEQHPDSFFLFVGGPMEYAEPYIDMFEKLGIDKDRYRFVDRRPYYEIHEWLAAADVLVHPLPSHPIYDKITSPLKILEYMTANRPIIISDLPSLHEILQHNKNALMVNPSDPNSFADAVLKLFNDPVFARQLASKAKHDVEKRSWFERAHRIKYWIQSL